LLDSDNTIISLNFEVFYASNSFGSF